MEGLTKAALEAFDALWPVFSAPPDLTVSQWADRERHLSPEASAEPGRWNTNRAEYQRGIMDAVSDPDVFEVCVMSGTQCGKTEIVNNVVGFHVDQDPAPLLVLQPTLDMAHAWSKDRLAPMLRDTPALKDKVKDARTRDSGNTLLHKTFTGGAISIVGANAAAGLASRPIRVVLADEVDRYPVSAGTEGDPVSLAIERTSNFWNAKIILTSTPTIKHDSRIETAYLASDRRKFWVPCPDCGEHQTLKWANVRWNKGEPETALYTCEHCGTLWDDPQRWAAVSEGEWRAEGEFKGKAGFWLSKLYSPWTTMAGLATKFLAAKPYPDLLQVFVNTSLAETWEEKGETVSDTAIDARRENYGPEGLPADVEFLTAGVDTQGDRLEIEVVGWNRDERSWGVEYRVFPGDPAQDHVWVDLDRYLLETFQAGSRKLRIQAVAIDSGGHHAEAVYRFAATRVRRRVWAIKGMAGPGRPVWPLQWSKTNTNDRVFIVGVDAAKDAVTSRWLIDGDNPGACAIPADEKYGYNAEWVRQMTSEERMTRFREGRPYKVWMLLKGRRNEAFDCRVYAFAAMRSVYRGMSAEHRTERDDGIAAPTPRGRRVRSRGI